VRERRSLTAAAIINKASSPIRPNAMIFWSIPPL
jgi:hypothetical protein